MAYVSIHAMKYSDTIAPPLHAKVFNNSDTEIGWALRIYTQRTGGGDDFSIIVDDLEQLRPIFEALKAVLEVPAPA